MQITQPRRSVDHSNRTHECEDALRPAFDELVEQALERGWDNYEVALSLMNLGEQLVRTITESAGSEADIAIAKALFEVRRGF
ncbi:MAG: hypothetical protein ACRECY_05795 [Phyllobacterium sp.]